MYGEPAPPTQALSFVTDKMDIAKSQTHAHAGTSLGLFWGELRPHYKKINR